MEEDSVLCASNATGREKRKPLHTKAEFAPPQENGELYVLDDVLVFFSDTLQHTELFFLLLRSLLIPIIQAFLLTW